MKIKRVVWVARIVRVTLLRFGPADDLADILDQDFTFGDVLQREHSLAVHAGATDLDAAIG